jgi:hypothetical protein
MLLPKTTWEASTKLKEHHSKVLYSDPNADMGANVES